MNPLPANDPALAPDHLALIAIRIGAITVDVQAGEVWRNGRRAEYAHNREAYGYVRVATPTRAARAHRVVWIAANGLLPPGTQINHANSQRWDNRLANLELVFPRGNSLHAHGHRYARVRATEWQAAVAAWEATEPGRLLVPDDGCRPYLNTGPFPFRGGRRARSLGGS